LSENKDKQQRVLSRGLSLEKGAGSTSLFITILNFPVLISNPNVPHLEIEKKFLRQFSNSEGVHRKFYG
jgi:hypothetical protein